MRKTVLTALSIITFCLITAAQNTDSIQQLLAGTSDDTSRANLLIEIANNYSKSDPELTYHTGMIALKISTKINYEEGILKCYTLIGVHHLFRGNLDSAEIYTLRAFELARKLKDKSSEATQYNSLGLIYLEKGDYSTALEYFQTAISNYRKLKEKDKMTRPLNNLGMCYQNMGEYQKAIIQFEEAIAICVELKDDIGKAINYGNLGVVFENIGSYEKAMKHYLDALKIFEEENYKTGLAPLYVNIASVLTLQGEFQKALIYSIRSYEIAFELGEQKNITNALLNIGSIYLAQQKMDSALVYFDQAHEITKEKGFKHEEATILYSIATIYNELGQNQNALNYLNKSSYIQNEINDRVGLVKSKILIGKIKLKRNQYNVGVIMLEDAIKIANSINFIEGMKDASFELAHAYASKNKHQKAFDFINIYSQYKDSLMNREKSRLLSEVQVRFQIDKIEKRNEILEKERQLEDTRHKNEQQRNRLYIYFALSGLVILFLVAALLFNRNQLKKKANKVLVNRNDEIEKQKEELSASHKIITDSIEYAKKIQESILPTDKEIKKDFTEFFVLYKPRNVVSGDFYWYSKQEQFIFIAVVDCTGHGVPGAFMSMIGNTLLNEIINEKKVYEPSEILEMLNRGVNKAMKQGTFEEDTQNDGMVLSLCRFEPKTNKCKVACANNVIYMVNEGSLEVWEGDIFNIGGIFSQRDVVGFTNKEFTIPSGSMLYLCTDGFKDQFGGPDNTKFMASRFEDLLIESSKMETKIQQSYISETFEKWKKDNNQVDDVLIFGLRVF